MYDAFGDESCGQEYVTYGVLLVPESQRSVAETILSDVKASFGGKPHDCLHCRKLFAGDARKKTPWAHLKIEQVFQLYHSLAGQICNAGFRRIVAVARKSDFPDTIPAILLRHVEPSAGVPTIWTKAFPLRDKQLASGCAKGTMIPLSKNPGLANIRFWPDPDSTSIEWHFGKRMADKTLDGFVDIGVGEEPARINIMPVVAGAKPPLLEIADCIAYVTQRSNTKTLDSNGRRFRLLHQAMAPEEIRYTVAANGAFCCIVPNAIRQTPNG